MMTLHGLPAAASFSIHLVLSKLVGKSLMKRSWGRPHLSTKMRRSMRSLVRTVSIWSRTMLLSLSMVFAVKRIVMSCSVMAFWALR